MSDTRSEIARGICCKTGWTAQRQTDTIVQKGNHERSDSFSQSRRLPGISECKHRQKAKYQGESNNDFRDKVGWKIANGGTGAEHRQLDLLIFRCLKMPAIGNPDDH